MICKKAMKIAMGVGMVLCATASFAEVTENFEGTIGNGWSDGTSAAVVEDNSQYGGSDSVGYPISGDHTKILNVEGEVSCTNSPEGTPTSSISDFLIFIPEPSDELDDEGLTDAKIAIAAGTNWVDETTVKLCLYCKAGTAATADWLEIANVKTSTWVRVTLVFENNRCRVSLDGEPVHNGSGYKTSAADAGSNGAWYNLANVPEGTDRSIASLSFIGCAKLDDVVIKDSFAEDAFTTDATLLAGEKASYNNLNKWGMTVFDVTNKWNTVLNKTSGMKVGEKIACGYDPNSDTKFVPVSITKTEAGQAKIKFPIESTSESELARYSVTVEGGSATTIGDAEPVDGEPGFATIELTGIKYSENSNVIKFILKASTPSSGSGTGE